MKKTKMENQKLSEVYAEAERVYNMKRDFIVPAEKIDLCLDAERDLRLRFIGDPSAADYKISPNAHGQISAKLEIPSAYYNRMLYADKELLLYNIAAWMPKYQAEDKRFLLRLLDGELRGFLSSRYNCLDNYNLLNFVKQKAAVHGCEEFQAVINNTNLYVKLLMPKAKGEIAVNDVVQQGLIIRNSEVGKGAMSITPFFLRLVCLNGMIAPSTFRAVHLGGDRHEGDFWTESTRNIEAASIWSKVSDMMDACFNGNLLSRYIEDMNRSKAVGFDRPIEEISDIGVRYVIPKPDIKEITDRYINGNDSTLFGLVNTMTDYAKHKPIEDQIDLESKAYKVMVDLTNRRFKAADIEINPRQNDQGI